MGNMKKILLTTVIAVSALFVSCSYTDAWEVPTIKLGAYEKVFKPTPEEGDLTIRATSNVAFEAHIVKGSEWIKFADTVEPVLACSGSRDIHVHYGANLYGKRVGHIVLCAESRRDTVFIKQHGVYEDNFSIYDEDKAIFTSGTTIDVPEEGKSYTIRLNCNEISSNVKVRTTDTDIIDNLLFEHDVLSFTVKKNTYERPRQAQIELWYVNGWDETVSLMIYIDQAYMLRIE